MLDQQLIKDINKILYISPGGIGNLVLAVPALRTLRKSFPKARITLLTAEQGVHHLIEHEGLVDDVYIADRSQASIWQFVTDLRTRRFDLALTAGTVDPFSAGALMWLSGIRVRAGENIQGRGFLYTVKVPHTPHCHECEGALNIVESLGLEPVQLRPDLCPTSEEMQFAETFLLRNGWSRGDLLVGVHAGSSLNAAEQKRWPKDNFVEVIKPLLQKSVKVLLIAGLAERSLTRMIQRELGDGVINTDAALTLRQTVAAIYCCRLFISNDSGIAHIAAALGIPLVVLFGPTDPARIAPKGQKVVLLQTAREAPVSEISVQQVQAAVNGLMKGVLSNE